jgi:hypothetical protein
MHAMLKHIFNTSWDRNGETQTKIIPYEFNDYIINNF